MGSCRKEFVSFSNANSNTDSDTNAYAYTNSNFVSHSQTHQPVNQHNVQRWHKPDFDRFGVERSSDATYFQ